MKNVALIIVGLIFLLFVAICPLPAMLAIPGIALRIIIGYLAVFCLLQVFTKWFLKDKFKFGQVVL